MSASDETFGTVARVIRLLQGVAESGDFTLKDMSTQLDLPPSTVHRLLQLLMKFDFVERRPNQTYRASREFYRVGSLVQSKFDLNSAARPYLSAIAETYREICSFALYMPATRTGMIVDTIRSPHPLQYYIEPFAHWPLTWGALGRAMLSALPEEDVVAILAEAQPAPATGQAPPSFKQLVRDLKIVHEQGFYVSINQNVLGATGTAAPVFGPDGRLIGSLGLTIPLARYDPRVQERISRDIADTAQRFSAALGYRAPMAQKLEPVKAAPARKR
jgi:DNA-binding IclR family transcriptional regulator